MVYLVVLSILGYAALLIALNIYTSAEAPLVSCALTIGLLYLCSLCGILLISAYVLFVGGFIALVASMVTARKRLGDFIKQLLQPGFVFFVLAALVLYPLTKPVVMTSWDEFSHWGLITKYLLQTNHLPIADSVVKFIHYPPGTALFQYFIARFSGGSEGVIYYGHLLLLASCMVVAVKNIPWKKFGILVLAMVLPIVIMLRFTVQSVFSLYTDSVMAFMAFAVVVSYMRSERKLKDVLKPIPILFIMPLIRESSATFAIFAIVIMVVDQIATLGLKVTLNKRKDKISRKMRLMTWFKQHHTVLIAVALLIVVLLSIGTWRLHLSVASPGSDAYHTKASLPKMVSDFMNDPWKHIRFAQTFFEAGYQKVIGTAAHDFGGWTTPAGILLWLSAFMIGSTLLLYRDKKVYNRIRAFNWTLVIELGIYMVGLLFIYMYRFTDLEAGNLASYTRYMGSIEMFVVSSFTAMLVYHSLTLERPGWLPKVYKGLVLFACASIILTSNPASYNILAGRATDMGKRQAIIDRTREARSIIAMEDKVYQVWQGTQGEEYYTSRFELMASTNSWGWSLGQGYFDNDLWTATYTQEEWAKILVDGGYDYVFIGYGDRRLWRIYGELFDQPDAGYTTYKVTPEGEYLLTACPESKVEVES